jgi:hypothetical protein
MPKGPQEKTVQAKPRHESEESQENSDESLDEDAERSSYCHGRATSRCKTAYTISGPPYPNTPVHLKLEGRIHNSLFGLAAGRSTPQALAGYLPGHRAALHLFATGW